jgi:bifunctional isochorismate lyase/aryl carrier protein
MTLDAESLRADVAAVLGAPRDELIDDQTLLDQGLDSIRLMFLVEQWRARGVSLTFAELAELAERPTLDDWTTLLCGPRQPR